MHRSMLVAACFLVACSKPKPATPAPDVELDRVASQFFEQHHLVGLAVGVVRNDSVIFAKGYGNTAVGGGRRVTDSTIFHMASVTKPFVATAVVQLAEQGKVNLDRPVSEYVTYFKMKDPRATGITVRQVLTHTAGMPDVTDYAWGRPEYDAGALERYIKGLKDSTLIFTPGEKWQ